MCIPRKKLTYPEHVDQAHRERRPFLEDPTAVSTQGTSRQIKQILGGELFARWIFLSFWERVLIKGSCVSLLELLFHCGFLRRECERANVEVHLQLLWMSLRSGQQVQAGKEEKRYLRPGLG